MRAVKAIGAVLLWAVILALLAIVVVPPFLDRIYYRGPVTGHFDGAHFHNPDGDMILRRGGMSGRMLRFFLGRDRAVWPDHVAIKPGVPPFEATACPVTPATVRENWARCVAKVDPRAMWVTWVGHSTVLVQAGGLNILTDPIWSEKAGVWGTFGPRRVRAPGIRFEDLPKIDLVLVSHNHYDHMDLATLKRLWRRDRPLIVTSLGNDTLIRGAGAEARAADWGQAVPVRPGYEVIIERVHHWGTRWATDRNRALWSGFTVRTPAGNIFYAGDTGFGDGSWPRDAARHGPFRLAIIPIGAFRPREMMQPSHIGPIEAVSVFRTLNAQYGLGVHWGTFQLSSEGMYDPPNLLVTEGARASLAPGRFRTMEVGRTWKLPASSPD